MPDLPRPALARSSVQPQSTIHQALLFCCLQGFRGTIHEVDSKTAGKSYAINGTIFQVLLSRQRLRPHLCLRPSCVHDSHAQALFVQKADGIQFEMPIVRYPAHQNL